jgi:hypothetical protein
VCACYIIWHVMHVRMCVRRRWAIPFLDRHGLMLAGFVAIAPVGVESWGGPWEYTHKQVTMGVACRSACDRPCGPSHSPLSSNVLRKERTSSRAASTPIHDNGAAVNPHHKFVKLKHLGFAQAAVVHSTQAVYLSVSCIAWAALQLKTQHTLTCILLNMHMCTCTLMCCSSCTHACTHVHLPCR